MVQELVNDLRARRAERSRVEVKDASKGCPKSVRDTLSAFSNGEGGVIILGLSDKDFEATPIDVGNIRDAVANMAANDLEPPVRAAIEIETLDDGHQVVVVEVSEADQLDKPVFDKNKGKYGGSYIRSGDGDHRLSNYEIDRLLENRSQPKFDIEPVNEASVDDLDSHLLSKLIERVIGQQPRVFKDLDRENTLRKLGVLTKNDEGQLVPTLAGLLTFGEYPQQYNFFPQLFVSVVVLPTNVMGEVGPLGERFIDNKTCEGPIPYMLTDAIDTVMRHLSKRAIISEMGRTDLPELPGSAIRELIANAIMHRDYSPQSRGSQIQVELYPDRLVVRSPGGIYGGVDPADFGQPDVSSSRNVVLSKLLADTTTIDGRVIAENRGSGIPSIIKSLADQGIAPPQFDDKIRSLTVTVQRNSSSIEQLADSQRLILSIMNEGELKSMSEIEESTGLGYRTALNAVNKLIAMGLLVPTAPKRSKNRRYTLAERSS